MPPGCYVSYDEPERKFADLSAHLAALTPEKIWQGIGPGIEGIMGTPHLRLENFMPEVRLKILNLIHGSRIKSLSEMQSGLFAEYLPLAEQWRNMGLAVPEEIFTEVETGARQFILARIEKSPARDRIRVTGYVSAPDLAGWYARAAVFAFPSLDEGFGMPVLEAMAAGVPVVASNRSALPEVVGDAAVLVDPVDSEALGLALRELTLNVEWRGELARRGTERAQCFTWEKAVRETWDVYRTLLG